MARQIEMVWPCSSCGTRNGGRQMVCEQCGNPKDGSEKYELPSNTRAAPTITDPDLLRKAHAGPNWRCRYCGSDQRRLDGSCLQCSATPSVAPAKMPMPRKEPRHVEDEPWQRGPAVVVAAITLGIGGLFAWFTRTREFDATVAALHWEQTIDVEKYSLHAHEDWASEVPSDAVEVKSLGDRVHHRERVFDHNEPEEYFEKVRCGEDCEDLPPKCEERCSSNENGFATCEEVCAGGGRVCSPRYCDEPRTRQVPVYRQEPRYAEYASYQLWEWKPERTVAASGEGTADMRWPVEEARIGADLEAGEQEREKRRAQYVASLDYDDGDRMSVGVSLEQYMGLSIGSVHHLVLKGHDTSLDGVPVVRLSEE